MNTHEHYEELCALAASGQGTPGELTDLWSHLETCPTCRRAAYDFTQISAQALSQLAARRLYCQIPTGMAQRFLARARSEGIEITRENTSKAAPPNRHPLIAGICAVAAVILVAGFLTVGKQRFSPVAADHGQPPGYPTTAPSARADPRPAQAQEPHLQQELASVRGKMTSMEATIGAQRTELESLSKTKESLTSRLNEAERGNARIQSERAERDARIAQLEGETEKSRSEKNASDTALVLQETELHELRKRIADQAEALGHQQQFAAKSGDVRELVVARNLHIIDVHDRDGNGKSQRCWRASENAVF